MAAGAKDNNATSTSACLALTQRKKLTQKICNQVRNKLTQVTHRLKRTDRIGVFFALFALRRLRVTGLSQSESVQRVSLGLSLEVGPR